MLSQLILCNNIYNLHSWGAQITALTKVLANCVYLWFGFSEILISDFWFLDFKKKGKGWTELCGKDVEGYCMINELSYLSMWKQLLIIQ